jgi:hypothetical protein
MIRTPLAYDEMKAAEKPGSEQKRKQTGPPPFGSPSGALREALEEDS